MSLILGTCLMIFSALLGVAARATLGPWAHRPRLRALMQTEIVALTITIAFAFGVSFLIQAMLEGGALLGAMEIAGVLAVTLGIAIAAGRWAARKPVLAPTKA